MRKLLYFWYLFGMLTMGFACGCVWNNEGKVVGILSLIGLIGIVIYVAFLDLKGQLSKKKNKELTKIFKKITKNIMFIKEEIKKKKVVKKKYSKGTDLGSLLGLNKEEMNKLHTSFPISKKKNKKLMKAFIKNAKKTGLIKNMEK